MEDTRAEERFPCGLSEGPQSAAAVALPNEVLALIFEAYVHAWEEEDEADYGWFRLWAALRRISGVCRQWRSVSLRTPRVWRNIWYGRLDDLRAFESIAGRSDAIPYYSYQTCLQRSRAIGCLRLHVNGMTRFLELMEHVHHLGALERVGYIHLEACSEDVDDGGAVQAALIAPLMNTPLCPNLRRLELMLGRTLPAAVLRALLERCSTVEHLSVLDTRPRDRPEAALEPVVLRHARALRIEQPSRRSMQHIFSLLSAGHLEELDLVRDSEPSTDMSYDMRLPCPGQRWMALRSLSYRGTASTRDVRALLGQTPDLEELGLIELRGEENYDGLLHALELAQAGPSAEADGDRHALVPSLRLLWLHKVTVSPSAIRGLVNSRRRRKAPLKWIGLSQPYLEAFTASEIWALRSKVRVSRSGWPHV